MARSAENLHSRGRLCHMSMDEHELPEIRDVPGVLPGPNPPLLWLKSTALVDLGLYFAMLSAYKLSTYEDFKYWPSGCLI
jgi:hypothetical protein